MTQHRFHVKQVAVAASLLALVSACTTVGPDYHVPDDAVAKRSAASAPFMGAAEQPFKAEPLPKQWWRLYHDATLDALIAKAFAANADLRVAAANLERAHAVLEEVEEHQRPELETGASTAYGRIAGAALAIPETLPNMGLYSGDLRVGYQVDLFGKIRRAIEAAEADQEAAQAASDLTHVTVAADTARAYADACSAGYQIKVAQRSVELQQKFVGLTGQRVARGRGIALDNSRARSQLEQLRAALPPLHAQRRTALYRLAVLTGEAPSKFPASVAQCDTAPRVGGPAAPPARRPPGRACAGGSDGPDRRGYRRAVSER
jgi:outer membrane protein TolC